MKKLDFSDTDIARQIISISENYGYKGIEKGGTFWIENSLDEKPFEYSSITASNLSDADAILKAYEIEYAHASEIVEYYSKCLTLLSSFAKEISLENVEYFKRGVTFCPRSKLAQLFREGLAPIFFGTCFDGEIIIIKTSVNYWRRASFNRSLYTLSHYSHEVINRQTRQFRSLSEWNSLEPDAFLSIILRLVQYLFFPYVCGFSASHGIGLKLIFIPNVPFKHERAFFPADWLDFMRAETELAGEAHEDQQFDLSHLNRRSIYGKYYFENPPEQKSLVELMKWGIASANHLIAKIYDVTNFSAEDLDDVADPIYAQEYMHSVMHVLRDAGSIIVEDSRYRNKATVFRMADILSAIAAQGTMKKRDDEFFRELFSTSLGKLKIKNILVGTQLGALKIFSDAIDGIYDRLKKTILDSLFVTSKRQLGGVLVRTPSLTAEQFIPEDEFCVRVLRSLRNTQHGYFTRADQSLRPSRFLSLIDGSTPDDFPSLGIAWAVALLACPKDLIGNP
jgi:hypothetical protein